MISGKSFFLSRFSMCILFSRNLALSRSRKTVLMCAVAVPCSMACWKEKKTVF